MTQDRSMIPVVCKKCGHGMAARPRSEVLAEISLFNAYFDRLDEKGKQDFGNKKSSFANYLGCFQCGNPYINFRDAKEGDIRNGSTMQAILYFTEDGTESVA